MIRHNRHFGALGDADSDSPLRKVETPPAAQALYDAHAAAVAQVDELPETDAKQSLKKRLNEILIAIRAREISISWKAKEKS